MRYVKPHYFDDFICIADKCPDTCCAGWQIIIDEESLERYSKVEGDFGNRLKNSIDWEEGAFQQYERRCVFLNDGNLCELYQELGKDALCQTCRIYPRHVEEFEGLREYSLSLSCPQAARMILGCQEKVNFLEWNTEEEDDFEEFDFLLFTQLEDARDVMIGIIQNRSLDLRSREKLLMQLAAEMQKCIEEACFFRMEEVIQSYQVWTEETISNKSLDKEKNTLKKMLNHDFTGAEDLTPKEMLRSEIEATDRYEWVCRNFTVFHQLEVLREDWTRFLEEVWAALYDKGKADYLEIYEKFQKEYGYESANRKMWEIQGEQLLLFFVYTYVCGAVYDDNVYSKMALSVYSLLWIQEFVMFLWVKQEGSLTFEDIVAIACRYAREVEHSDVNLELLEEWFWQDWEEKEE